MAVPYLFDAPLEEGLILARPNRFVMDVRLASGEEVRCHCPVVSRIGTLDTAGRPCLLSLSPNPKRKFARTVEALSLNRPEDADKSWIGINQTASNKYVGHFLRTGALAPLAGEAPEVRREVPFGASRLDFLVDESLYLEVKTPLVQLQVPLPDYVGRLPDPPFSSTDRAMRHLRELAASLHENERAAILYTCYYDNPGFRLYRGTTFEEVCDTVREVRAAGVELWQANFEVTPHGVDFGGLWRLDEAVLGA